MSKKDDIPIGEIMTRKNGEKYEVLAGPTCKGCAFRLESEKFCEDIPCYPECRLDRQPVIFVRRKDLEALQEEETKTV